MSILSRPMTVSRVSASAIALALALGVGFTSSPATADATPVEVETGFGYWQSDTFADVYSSITASNEPEVAANILLAGTTDPEAFPALSQLSEQDRAEVLAGAASAAAQQASLPSDVAAKTMTSEAVLAVWGLGSPIIGYTIANGFTWEHKDRYYYKHCDNAGQNCSVDDWKDFTYRVDPGGSGTRLTVSTLTHGTRLPSHRVDAQVFRDAQMIRLKDGPTRQGDGTYTIALGPHLTLTDYTFAAAIQTSVWGPTASGLLYVWRTGPTSQCTEPVPGAWRCIFLD